jgi:hypothetical protein
MREFQMILAAGLGCAALGAGFGWIVGKYAPEFIAMLAQPLPIEHPERVAMALGAVNGLLIGAAAMCLGLILSVLRAWLGPPRDKRNHCVLA